MRLGIDLGGTKIEIVALDDSGKELLRRRVPTPKGNYYDTLQAIAQLVRDAEAELGQRGSVGIGTPGALSRATGRLKNSNSVVLNDQPILQDLESLLQRKVQDQQRRQLLRAFRSDGWRCGRRMRSCSA